MQLTTPIQFLPGVGPRRAAKFAKLGLKTAQDALFLFPRDHEFPAPAARIDELREGQPASLVGKVVDAEIVSRTPGKSVFGALIQNESGSVRVLFFNQAFRVDQLTIDRQVLVSGTPKLNGLRMEMVHPKVVLLEESEQVARPRILPIYPLTEGLKQADLRGLIATLLAELAGELTEVMPRSVRQLSASMLQNETSLELPAELPRIDDALRGIHFPNDEQALTAARTRFVFQELFVMQLALAIRRRRLTTDLQAPPLPRSAMVDARIVNRFPFELTVDQRRAIDDISRDMARQFPMNRLLQGDVGSGKTVVAFYAMMLAVASGHQAVLMAPTEVLARQHFASLSQWLKDSRVRIGLLCGSLTSKQRRDVLQQSAAGDIDLLIGTQALLYGEIEFQKLGLCVIDEQHKFGVEQRVRLRSSAGEPHYLVMSATPIPRSIAMTLFGDVDLSTIRSRPPGHGKVNTYLAIDGWKDRWWNFVKDRINEGRQAFVVAPRVASGPDNDEAAEDVSSVEKVYRELSSGPLSQHKVGLLHGRMSNADKQAVMQAFADGELEVLVSTTVIEVGIDVPNATVMTILGAQRFGLAQLHQLRGRVSRGTHTGHVCIFTDGPQSPEENERLKVLERTDNGFELAEADFALRGPGDLLGRRQSGLPPMRIADLTRDQEILLAARRLAQQMIDEDPELSAESLAELKQQVIRRYGTRLQIGDVA